jgi:hypothetical protein
MVVFARYRQLDALLAEARTPVVVARMGTAE